MSKILPVLIIVLLVSLILFSPLFKINKVNVKDENNCLTSKSEDKGLNILGNNIISLNTKALTKKIKEINICVDQAKVVKMYPNTIYIEVQTKEPIVIINGTGLTIREDGYVGDQLNSKDLPKIFLPESIKVQKGIKITDSIVSFALKTTSELLKSDFIPTSIRILNPPDIAIYDSKGIIALFTQDKETGIQVDSLQSVFAKAKIDPTKIAKIDLRFDKPVITTKQ